MATKSSGNADGSNSERHGESFHLTTSTTLRTYFYKQVATSFQYLQLLPRPTSPCPDCNTLAAVCSATLQPHFETWKNANWMWLPIASVLMLCCMFHPTHQIVSTQCHAAQMLCLCIFCPTSPVRASSKPGSKTYHAQWCHVSAFSYIRMCAELELLKNSSFPWTLE